MSNHTTQQLAQEFLRQTQGGLDHLASKPEKDLTPEIDRLIAQIARQAGNPPRMSHDASFHRRQAA